MHRLIARLALNVHESGWKFDKILCLARGGLRVGDQMSRIFDVPLAILAGLMEATGQLDPDFASPFIHTQHYEVGDIVLWDNRVLMHRAKHGTASGNLTTHRLTMLDGLETPGYPV